MKQGSLRDILNKRKLPFGLCIRLAKDAAKRNVSTELFIL